MNLLLPGKRRTPETVDFPGFFGIDATRFELATSASRTQRSTKLSHASSCRQFFCQLDYNNTSGIGMSRTFSPSGRIFVFDQAAGAFTPSERIVSGADEYPPAYAALLRRKGNGLSSQICFQPRVFR